MYETESYWNVEEIKKMNRAFLFKLNKWYLILVTVVELVILVLSVMCFMRGSAKFGFIYLSFLIIFPLLIVLRYNLMAKKAYNTNKLLQNNTTRFAFLEDRFEISSGRGNTVIRYDELYKVLETDTNFYLFISNQQAYNIIKANCSEELIQFLKGLIK